MTATDETTDKPNGTNYGTNSSPANDTPTATTPVPSPTPCQRREPRPVYGDECGRVRARNKELLVTLDRRASVAPTQPPPAPLLHVYVAQAQATGGTTTFFVASLTAVGARQLARVLERAATAAGRDWEPPPTPPAATARIGAAGQARRRSEPEPVRAPGQPPASWQAAQGGGGSR